MFLIVIFFLPTPASAQDDIINRQVIVLFTEDALVLPGAATRATLNRIELQPTLADLFSEFDIVEVEKGFPSFTRADTLRLLPDGTEYRTPDWTNLFILTLSSELAIDDIIKKLSGQPEVVFVERNQFVSIRSSTVNDDKAIRIGPKDSSNVSESKIDSESSDTPPNTAKNQLLLPNDTHFNRQWALKNDGTFDHGSGTPGADIKAWKAWDITTGNSTIKIGIIDSGVQGSHEDLTGRVSGSTTDLGAGHGTGVAGVTAAKGNNNKGISGVNWNAQIQSQYLGSTPTSVAAALDAAVMAGAKVINNSWGYATPSTLISSALIAAYQADKLLVNANPETGNANAQSDYPNNVGPWILNVAAMTNTN